MRQRHRVNKEECPDRQDSGSQSVAIKQKPSSLSFFGLAKLYSTHTPL
jgi:hypothetical protein